MINSYIESDAVKTIIKIVDPNKNLSDFGTFGSKKNLAKPMSTSYSLIGLISFKISTFVSYFCNF